MIWVGGKGVWQKDLCCRCYMMIFKGERKKARKEGKGKRKTGRQRRSGTGFWYICECSEHQDTIPFQTMTPCMNFVCIDITANSV